jgi:hypothetical protein
MGRGSSVGTATRYGLDCLGIESRWGFYPLYTRVFPGGKATGAWR